MRHVGRGRRGGDSFISTELLSKTNGFQWRIRYVYSFHLTHISYLSSLLHLIDLTGGKTQTDINIPARVPIAVTCWSASIRNSGFGGDCQSSGLHPIAFFVRVFRSQQLPLTQGNRSALTTADLHFQTVLKDFLFISSPCPTRRRIFVSLCKWGYLHDGEVTYYLLLLSSLPHPSCKAWRWTVTHRWKRILSGA